MAEIPELINDLAYILMSAGIVTLIFKRLKQPLVLGYIVAGFLVSPHMPYTASVVDTKNVHLWADIGVMFLLFSLGLDFSFKKILKMGASPIISTITIIFSMALLGVAVGHAFNWSRMDCIFLGGMLAMSSTTIIYKAFDDLGLRQQQFAGLVMSVLILEDILAIVMMVMLSAIAAGDNPDGGQMLGSIVKIGFFLVLWLVVGIFAVPAFLRKIRRLVNDEVLLIVALGLCCAMAVFSTKVGFSSAFGAFIMGSILAETIEAEHIEKLVEPVKNLFGAIFFVSVGMLVDPQILIDYAFPILALVLTILIGQSTLGSLSFMLGGESLKSAMRCGFSMHDSSGYPGLQQSGASPAVENHPAAEQAEHEPSGIDGEESVEATVDTDGCQHAGLRHPDISHHCRDVYVLPAIHPRSVARRASGNIRQHHYGRADRHLHLTIPARYDYEEKPFGRVAAAMGGEQQEPSAPAVYYPGACHHCRGVYLLHLPLSEPSDQRHRDYHRSDGRSADGGLANGQAAQYQAGATLYAEPAFARHRGTGARQETSAVRRTIVGPRYPYCRFRRAHEFAMDGQYAETAELRTQIRCPCEQHPASQFPIEHSRWRLCYLPWRQAAGHRQRRTGVEICPRYQDGGHR